MTTFRPYRLFEQMVTAFAEPAQLSRDGRVALLADIQHWYEHEVLRDFRVLGSMSRDMNKSILQEVEDKIKSLIKANPRRYIKREVWLDELLTGLKNKRKRAPYYIVNRRRR